MVTTCPSASPARSRRRPRMPGSPLWPGTAASRWPMSSPRTSSWPTAFPCIPASRAPSPCSRSVFALGQPATRSSAPAAARRASARSSSNETSPRSSAAWSRSSARTRARAAAPRSWPRGTRSTPATSRARSQRSRSSRGFITEEDLAAQHVTIEPPVHTAYRGIDVFACGPWSQGPLVPMTLNLLEGYDVSAMGPGSLAYLHRYTEAMKLAAADREGFFGDPDQVDVPIRGLLDKGYAQERRDLIRDDRAWPELPPPGDPWPHEGRSGPPGYVPRVASGVGAPDTSYCCAMDAEGNAFSATPSDPGLGSPLVEGLGMIVSTRGAQLWTTPGHPSAIAPGKRPRLTPNPALLMKDGRALMPFGCPGEDAQCQAMVQVVCNIVDFGMNTQA